MRQRFVSKRFKFDVENYYGSLPGHEPMKRIKIYCEGAMQVDLWLDESDVNALQLAIDYSNISKI